MSKLLKLKKWLTLPDAARRLSLILSEDVQVADLLELALDRHLRISVQIVNRARARRGRWIPAEQSEVSIGFKNPDNPDKTEWLHGLPGDLQALKDFADMGVEGLTIVHHGMVGEDGNVLKYDDQIHVIEGVWDLPLMGAERLDVEHLLQQERGGPAVEMLNLEGALIQDDAGQIWQLQERFARAGYEKLKLKKFMGLRDDHPNFYYPAPGLPEDSVLVVKVAALTALSGKLLSVDEPANPHSVLPMNEAYTTPLLQAQKAAIRQFWERYDPKRPPKSEEIVGWLTENYDLSDREAAAIDTIIRPSEMKRGGNRQR